MKAAKLADNGTRWVVKVILPDGRHVRPYVGPGVSFADARRLAKGMAHPAYAAKVYDPPFDAEQWPASAQPRWNWPLAQILKRGPEPELLELDADFAERLEQAA